MKNRILRVLALLLLAAVTSHAQVLTQAEYFVDADPGVGLATPIAMAPGETVIGNFSIPLSGLSPGFHWVYVRARDVGKRWSIAMPTKFYIFSPQPEPAILPRYFPITKAEYFYDADPGEGLGFPLPLIRGDTVVVDRYLRSVGLDTGYHYLYVRAMDQMNLWGLAKRIRFHVDTAICSYPIANFTFDTVTYGMPCHLTDMSTNTVSAATYRWEIYAHDTVIYTTQNVVHTFTSPGYYKVKLTVTNGIGCTASILRDVMTGPLPLTNLLIAGSTSLCKGDSVILSSNNYEAGTRYDWSNCGTTRAITVKSEGSYYCWVTNPYGISLKSETVYVHVHDVPAVTLTSFNATGGHANGSAWADITSGTGAYVVNWSTGATGNVLNGLAPGSYTVTVTDGNCPVVKEFTIINTAVQQGDIVAAEYFFDSDPGQGNGIPINIWSGDTVDYKFTVPIIGLQEGYHHLYIRTKDTRGIWGIDKWHKIFVYPPGSPPRPPVQPPITQAEYFINTDPGVGNGINIPITPGDLVDRDFYFYTLSRATGFYNLYIRTRDASGKWGQYAMTPFYIYDSQRHDLTKNYKYIAGVEYFYDADPGVRNCSIVKSNIYETIDLTRDIRIGSLAPGLHRVYLRPYDEKGITGLWKRIDFTVLNVSCTCPTVDFNVDTVNILGNPTHFVDISGAVSPGALYEWDVNGDGVIDYNTPNVNHVYPQYGLYNARLTVRNTTNCYASMTRQVVVSPVIDTSLTIAGNTTFCDGNSVILTAKPGYTYNWSSDEITQSITVTRSGDYFVRLTNIFGVQGFSRKIHVTVYPVPTVNIVTINANVGKPNGSAICNVTGGTGNYAYLWSTGENKPIINNLAAGNYSVTVNDGRCPVISEFTIGSDPVFPGDIVKAEYFFDADPGVGNATPMNIAGGTSIYYATLIPVGGLMPGYHQLFVRAADTYNRWSIVKWERFFVNALLPPLAVNRPPLVKGEYFYDQDPGVGNGTPISFPKGNDVAVDHLATTSGLPTGFHNLTVRVMDSVGLWGLARSQWIYINEIPVNIQPKDQPKLVAAEYFFDADPGVGKGNSITFSPTGDLINLYRYLPVTGLSAGSHRAYIRVKDEAGVWSLYANTSFNVFNTLCVTPSVNFTKVPTNAGQQVTYTNTSGNLTPTSTYEWDIGNDGIVDYITKDFTHTFAVSGTYNLKLTVFNSDTCKASILKEVYVGPLPPATITVNGNPTFCDGDSVQLVASPGYIYKWWPTGAITQSIYAKNTGSYYCWLRTATNLEVKSQVINVARHSIPVVTLHKINASGGNNNGSAWVDVSGGSGSYTFQWTSGATTYYANNLAPGNHSVQVNDGHCPVVKSFTIGTHPVVAGNILTAEYFFDTDPGVGLATPMNISAADTVEYVTGCNATGLSVGYHIVFIRVKDTYKRWSIIKQQSFFVFPTQIALPPANQPPITAGEYFVDLDVNNKPDPGVGSGEPFAVVPGDAVAGDFGYTVDTLFVGFHHVAARVRDMKGQWSHNLPALFYIYDTTYRNVATTQPLLTNAEYFLDNDPGVGKGTPIPVIAGELVTKDFGIPLGATPLGSHYAYIRVKDAGKKWSNYARAGFTVFACTQPVANFSFVPGCITTPVAFTDLSTNVNPAATYAWDFNNDGIVDDVTHGSVSHLYTIPGVYQCKLKITHNVACVDSVIKTVTFPFVHLQNDTTIYTDQSIVLDGGPGYTYLWSTGATTQTITVNGATVGIGLHNYSVVVTNNLACTATDNINITVTLPPRDLVIISASMYHDTIPIAGDSADMHCVIKNIGTISAVASVVQYYLSADNIKSPDDTYLGFGIVNALPPGASEAVTTRQFVPGGPLGQIWYIIFVADGAGVVVENNEGNNIKPIPFYYGQPSVPENLSVGDQIITFGHTRCYNALQTITVAGISVFQVQSGGSATFIAGLKIRFLPGVRVFPGGYLHGYITTTGQYCIPGTVINPLTASDSSTVKGDFTGIENDLEPPGSRFCYIYPNPTSGEFNLVLSSNNREWPVNVRIYNAYGALVKETILDKGRTHLFSLAEQKPGIYFLHIRHGDNTEMEKVIRY